MSKIKERQLCWLNSHLADRRPPIEVGTKNLSFVLQAGAQQDSAGGTIIKHHAILTIKDHEETRHQAS